MIVQKNASNSDKYNELFAKAYKFLESLNNGSVPAGKERFSSLAEYYGHIADLFEQQKYEYIMVPLDEEPFEIDLNTRKITVPKSFSKCASVQTDILAETIIFVVDRYFDFMDLANTNIYVQWTDPKGVPGATRVEMIDLDSEPGKIKFAWPLNDAVTKTPGVVKFAVRFFRITNDNSKELVYSLNTLDAEITIKAALHEDPTLAAVESPVNAGLFGKAILNSNYSAVGVNPPVVPIYGAPGTDIATVEIGAEDKKFIVPVTNVTDKGIKFVGLKDDTITLAVQAIAADSGEITYKWYYKAEDSDKAYDCENYQDIEGNKFGIVDELYLPVEDILNAAEHERYFTQNADGTYDEYFTRPLEADAVLFEKYSTFTVPATGTVTGVYNAAAWNTIDASGYVKEDNLTEARFNVGTYYTKYNKEYVEAEEFDADATYYSYVKDSLTTLIPAESTSCLLPGPREIQISSNLAAGAVLMPKDAEHPDELVANLAVEVEEDSYLPLITYAWKSSDKSADDVKAETNKEVIGTNGSYVATEPGWYGVEVKSELNRKDSTKFSNVIKVTKKPLPPKLVLQDSGYESVKNADVTFSVEVDDSYLDIEDKLLSDNVQYIWQMMIPDHDWTTIPANEPGISINENSITVNKSFSYTYATFRCLVVNELNGMKAVFDHSATFIPAADNKLGEFVNEAPYIYAEGKSFDFNVKNY